MSNKQQHEFESVILLLQGGGALGAYQAGVFQALSEAGMEPDWVAGISIGSVNAAIMAGNPPGKRLERLRTFWEAITFDHLNYVPPPLRHMLVYNDKSRQMFDLCSSMYALCFGIDHFFRPRMINPWLEIPGTLAATSFYDTTPLRSLLESLIDFDHLNHDGMRLTMGAVNVTSGNFTTFDNHQTKITVDHILASGALPPGLPAIKLDDGEYYWDGGLVSNTPLHWLLTEKTPSHMLVFQTDLWDMQGSFPRDMAEVMSRQKDIIYSSRTRANTSRFEERFQARNAIADLLKKLPEELRNSPEAKRLEAYKESHKYNIVHLIYHNKTYEGYAKDFEFSRLSMETHWQAGYGDTQKALRHPEIMRLPRKPEGIKIFDFNSEQAKSGNPKRMKSAA